MDLTGFGWALQGLDFTRITVFDRVLVYWEPFQTSEHLDWGGTWRFDLKSCQWSCLFFLGGVLAIRGRKKNGGKGRSIRKRRRCSVLAPSWTLWFMDGGKPTSSSLLAVWRHRSGPRRSASQRPAKRRSPLLFLAISLRSLPFYSSQPNISESILVCYPSSPTLELVKFRCPKNWFLRWLPSLCRLSLALTLFHSLVSIYFGIFKGIGEVRLGLG